jgi:hypothetical protein
MVPSAWTRKLTSHSSNFDSVTLTLSMGIGIVYFILIGDLVDLSYLHSSFKHEIQVPVTRKPPHAFLWYKAYNLFTDITCATVSQKTKWGAFPFVK